MTAVTTTAANVAVGAQDVVVAGGVEHMGHHPMGEGRTRTRGSSPSASSTPPRSSWARRPRTCDRYPHLTKERADAYAVASQAKYAKALANGDISPDLVPVATRSTELGGAWPRPTSCRARHHGRLDPRPQDPVPPRRKVTAGNASPLTDGATACLLAAGDVADELGLPARMRLVAYAYAGVDPEVMGIGPVPATERALASAGLTIDDIGLFEINEAFAVQVLAFLDHFGIADDDERVNQYGGAIAMGHPLASSGVRLMTQLARQFEQHPEVRYGLTTMCVGLGMGGTVIWENPHHADYSGHTFETAEN